jgi:uncharacterized membrane protein YhaH (DUF805 family)
MLHWLGYAAILAGVSIDIAGFVLGIRRLRGNGPSGVPIVGFVIVLIGVSLLYASNQLSGTDVKSYVAVYGLIHILLQFGLLVLLELMLRLLRR